jgi:hypothetical protein
MLKFVGESFVRMFMIIVSIFGNAAQPADPVDRKQAGFSLLSGKLDYGVFWDE